MSLKNAFLFMLNMQGQTTQFWRPPSVGSSTVTKTPIRAAISNAPRTIQGPENLVIKGREFVLSFDDVALASLSPAIRRGDKLEYPGYPIMTISEVTEMPDIGGLIMGYRVSVEG